VLSAGSGRAGGAGRPESPVRLYATEADAGSGRRWDVGIGEREALDVLAADRYPQAIPRGRSRRRRRHADAAVEQRELVTRVRPVEGEARRGAADLRPLDLLGSGDRCSGEDRRDEREQRETDGHRAITEVWGSSSLTVCPPFGHNYRVQRLRVFGAAGGAVFAILVLVAFAIAPGPSSANGETVVEYYSTHKTATLWQAALIGLAFVLFIWFAETFAGQMSSGSVGVVSAAATAALYLVAIGAW
jgi:hypothetical protein